VNSRGRAALREAHGYSLQSLREQNLAKNVRGYSFVTQISQASRKAARPRLQFNLVRYRISR